MAKKESTPSPSKPQSSNPSPSSSINQENPQRDQLPKSEARIDMNQGSSTENLQNLASSSSSTMRNKEKVEIYWNSMNLAEKQGILQVSYYHLLKFSKDFSIAEDFLPEATAFYDVHKQWKCWICCSCNRTFPDSQSHFGHVARTHLNDSLPLAPNLLFPLDVADRILMINDGIWEPVDIPVAISILKDQLKSLAFKNSQILKGENVSPFTPEQYFLTKTWPLSNDPIRVALLKEIRATLRGTLAANRLLTIHFAHVIAEAANKLPRYFSDFWLSDLGLEQTHLCVCLLDANELRDVLDALKRITSSNLANTSMETSAMNGTKVNIVLDKEMFRVLFDGGDKSTTSERFVSDIQDRTSKLPTAESLSSWIYSSPSSEQHWELPKQQRQENESKAITSFGEALKKLKQELDGDPNVIQRSKAGIVIRKMSTVIHVFASKINSIAAVDYQEILSFLLKSYIKFDLEKRASKDPTHSPDNKNLDVGGDQPKETAGGKQQLLDPEGNHVHSTGNAESNPYSENENLYEYLENWVLQTKGPSRGTRAEDAAMEAAVEQSLGEEGEKMWERRQAGEDTSTSENVQGKEAWVKDYVRKKQLSDLQKDWCDAVHEWCKSVVFLQQEIDKKRALAQSDLQKPWIEDYVRKEQLSILQRDWFDAVHEWYKNVAFFHEEVDKEGALAQSVLGKEKVFALFRKFVLEAIKLECTSSSTHTT